MPEQPPSDRVEAIWYELQQLGIEELRWLRSVYLESLGEDEEEGGAGVREPRRPRPESPGDAVALETDSTETENFQFLRTEE